MVVGTDKSLICANNHRGIDTIIPVLFGIHLKSENVSAIIIQAKNDRSYTANVRSALFTEMDPFKVGLFSKGEKDIRPIIRMVFALASNVSAVKVNEPPISPYSTRKATKKSDKFTAYDIWVAGATNQSFGVQNNTYSTLLQRSCKNFNGYDLIDMEARPSIAQQQQRAEARRRMHPGAAANRQHFENYVSSAQEIVVELDDTEDV